MALAAQAVCERVTRVAARELECDAADVAITDGRAHVTGFKDRGLPLASVLALAHRPDVVREFREPGLSAPRFWSPESVTWRPASTSRR